MTISDARPVADASTAVPTPGCPAAAIATGPRQLVWSDMEKQIDRIACTAEADGRPQTIVGVVRGGLVPAVMLAHRFGIRDVRAVEVTHTIDDTTDAVKTARPLSRNSASLGDVGGLDVLVVDDVAGTGETLAVVLQIVEQAGAARVRSAVLVVNEANWTSDQPPGESVTCIGERVRSWVVFPWETPAATRTEGAS